MVNLDLKGKIYRLPMSDLYEDKFALFVNNGIIEFTNLSGESLWKNIDSLFGYVANSLCVFDEDDGYPDELLLEKKEIRRRIASVDRLSKHFASKRDYDKAVSVMEEFLTVMLEHYGKLMDSDKQERVL